MIDLFIDPFIRPLILFLSIQPLHGAAHFAFLGVVKILVQDHNADTNIPSRAQLIPLQEVQQKTDKRSTRKAILQLLNETSPETLYSVLFAGCAASTTQEWLGRMLRAIKSLPTCKIFYTIVKAALKLELLTSPQQAQEWIEKAMEHVMRYCKSPVDFETLSTVVEHAAAEHDLSPALADVLRQFCRQGQSNSSNGSVGSHDSVDWNMKKAIRREILSFRALEGIDGKPSSIQRCLEFWQAAVAEMASARTDPWMAKRKALTGIMGAVLNAILLGNHNHINNHLNNPFFDQSVLYVTDFLNFHHMKQFVDNNRDWNRRRNSAVDELNRGRDKCETLLHQLGSSSSPWLEKGFVVLGLCSTVIPPREMSFGTSTETVQMGTRIQTTHLPNRNNRDRIHQGTTLLSERHLLPEESQDEPPRQSEPQPQQLPDNASLGGDSLESRQTSSTTGAPFSAAISHSTATSTHTGRTALSSRNNTVTRETATNLHWAIVEGSHEKVVAELERIRTLGTASINALDSLHRTPLDLAALSGQEEMALLIEASGGERSYFKTDQQMRAVMAYCSNDIPGNRHGLLRAYVGSTRGSSRSTSSSLTSKASRSTRSRRSDGRSVASSSTRTSGSRLRRGRAPTTVRFSAQQTDEQAA